MFAVVFEVGKVLVLDALQPGLTPQAHQVPLKTGYRRAYDQTPGVVERDQPVGESRIV